MSSTNDSLPELERLRAENAMLRGLLRTHGIEIPEDTAQGGSNAAQSMAAEAKVSKRSAMADKIGLFMSLFQGREDVYARRWESKNGGSGYSPVCKNEWRKDVCLKPRGKCRDCAHAEYLPYDESAVVMHLSGSCVLGVYPLLRDETCHFLAIDFDEERWRDDVRMVADTCRAQNVPCTIEISRSGNGAHLWFFFSETVVAAKARALGATLLTLAMREHARLSFKSYDRMFPNQDTMPKGGFGNLIALPLQVTAARQGGSLFVDGQLNPYADQWVYLSEVRKLSAQQVDEIIARLHTPPLGALRPEDGEVSEPWRQPAELKPGEVPPAVEIMLADRLYLPTAGFSNKAQNQIKRLAAFLNPQFYRAQAMRMPVWSIPRVICCAEYLDDILALPRGCLDDVAEWLSAHGVAINIRDKRCPGRDIDVSFNGTLREEQAAALKALSACDSGILSATTAFGKTVVGAALIAAKKVNTLILVHRTQLMTQWKERLEQFLTIREALPPKPKRRGRQKKREIVGLYGANRDTRGGIIDIAMLQSMGDADAIKPWIGDYGLVIVDECHHVPAVSFEQVMKAVRSKYAYGLTATPKRQDGHHPILHMYLGPIRYRVDAKQQAMRRPFSHVMIPRFTGARFRIDEDSKAPAIVQYYDQIMCDDLRNDSIIEDVLECAREGRNCLILSERTEHVRKLTELLRGQGHAVHMLLGGQTDAKQRAQLQALKDAPENAPLIVCATGKYIGEGFDDSRLDTLFLTMPISWQGTLAQYVGRLHRLHEGKRQVRVYDYIDNHAAMLEKMYHKRLNGYASIGYTVATGQDAPLGSDIIYNQNTFQERFLQDVASAKESVVIVSPFVTVKRVRWIEGILSQCTQRRVMATVVTRDPMTLPTSARKTAQTAIGMLQAQKVNIVCREGIHQKYAVIDGSVVWYGSVNLLSFGASQESVMRLVSSSIARALLGAK